MMSTETDNVDINDVFDNLVFAEENARKLGYDEGYSVGETQSVNGYHLGYHRAGILASQLGYYSGVVEYCLFNKNLFPPKIIEQAAKLQVQIQSFPSTNDETIDILKSFEDIKFQFSKLCSLAKINTSNTETKKLDF